MNSQGRLIARFTENLPAGTLEWIGLRPARKEAMQTVEHVIALEGLGLKGDRRCHGSPGSARQVTLISAEHLDLIAQFMGRDQVPVELLRRNLLVSGINLYALRHQPFRIGEAEFIATAHCHPCSRMESALGEGAVAAMLGYGGFCAKITKTGLIRTGDKIEKI